LNGGNKKKKMSYLLVRHKVEDFAKWKIVFDEMEASRKEHGSQGALVLRNADNLQEIVILTEFKELTGSQQYAQSPELREAMQRAGVRERPDVYFLELADKTPA
jgi:hypothetical protein